MTLVFNNMKEFSFNISCLMQISFHKTEPCMTWKQTRGHARVWNAHFIIGLLLHPKIKYNCFPCKQVIKLHLLGVPHGHMGIHQNHWDLQHLRSSLNHFHRNVLVFRACVCTQETQHCWITNPLPLASAPIFPMRPLTSLLQYSVYSTWQSLCTSRNAYTARFHFVKHSLNLIYQVGNDKQPQPLMHLVLLKG